MPQIISMPYFGRVHAVEVLAGLVVLPRSKRPDSKARQVMTLLIEM